MDVKNIKDSIKAEIKAELKPRKLLRTAFVPQTKGLLTPIKETFQIFVTLIAQMFVGAKLIPRDHPSATGAVHGFGAIWLMIVDAAANLKFKRENLYQIIVFYGIVGMLVFGLLDALAFVMHFGMGHAHAATPDSSTLFNEAGTSPSTDNAPNWINSMFPYANNTTTSSGIPYALQGMLVTYNTALLALGTAFALYQIAHLFMESAHHGKFGGNRYSQLHAPLRLVLGIGLLVPTTYGFNSAQLIAIEMAKMGSGLASNVWVAFENGLTAYNSSMPSVQAADVNTIVQKLVVDETCTVAALGNNGTSYDSGYTPTWNSSNGQGGTTTGSSGSSPNGATETNTGNAYVITFDDKPGDGHCGSITIPKQKSNQYTLASDNYFEQAFTGSGGILSTVWTIANDIYGNSQGGTNPNGAADPTLNPFASTCTTRCASPQSYSAWLGIPAQTSTTGTTTTATVTGILAQMQTAATNTAQAYVTAEGQPAASTAALAASTTKVTTDWTQAGSVLLKMTHDAADQGAAQNPTIDVALPDSDIMDAVTSTTASTDCSGFFSFLKFSCHADGKRVIMATATAIKNVNDGAKSSGLGVYSFNASSNGSGNGGGGTLLKALSGPWNTLMAGIEQVVQTTQGNGSGQSTVNTFGQSIFNVMRLGNVIMIVAGALVATGAAVGSTPFTIDLGNVVIGLGVALFPVAFSLAIMIPLMPAARFIFGLFTWILTLFEAIIAMPVVALITINFEGDGMFAHGKQGWFMLLQMMLRPVLMIFGLVGGLLIFDTLSSFIGTSILNVWFGLNPLNTSTFMTLMLFPMAGIGTLLQTIGFLYFYALTLYACANMSFGLINTIPDRILSWTGLPGGISTGNEMDGVMQSASQQASGMVGSAGQRTAEITNAHRKQAAQLDEDSKNPNNPTNRQIAAMDRLSSNLEASNTSNQNQITQSRIDWASKNMDAAGNADQTEAIEEDKTRDKTGDHF